MFGVLTVDESNSLQHDITWCILIFTDIIVSWAYKIDYRTTEIFKHQEVHSWCAFLQQFYGMDDISANADL